MRYFSIVSSISLLAVAADAAILDPRAAAPPICSTLNSCYARFTQSSTASAWCTTFLAATKTKSVTVTTTLSASTKLVTKIVTIKGTTTIPQTATVEAKASYVTSFQPCTTAATSSIQNAVPRGVPNKRADAGPPPGCLQYMVGTALAATSTACSCIATASTPTASFTKTVTPKVSTYTWTGTVSLQSTVKPVTTVTASPTYTVTMDALPCALASTTPTTPATCNNKGMQFEILTDVDPYYSFDNFAYVQDYLNIMKNQVPTATGITQSLGGFSFSPDDNGQTSIYNVAPPFNAELWYLNQQGYILATQTGTYAFTLSPPDDYVAVWLGPNAVSGWSESNANGVIRFAEPVVSFTYDMTAGQYYPFRLIYSNGGGPGGYLLQIVNPDGSNFTTEGNTNVVQFSCDSTTAPSLPAWAAGSVS